MSNYTKATNFAVKDGLTTGDPDKKVKGTEIDNEFNAIASAISSKADSNSPTLTGTPLAPTASSGTNNTQIATTAFVATAVSTAAGGTMAAQNANNVTITGGSITGITDLAIADGGTGASTKTAAYNALSPTTTKGDLEVHNGTDVVRVAVGSNNQVLIADSSQSAGVKWGTAGVSNLFTSSELSVADAAAYTIAHGLGGMPTLVKVYAVCKTAEYGFSVGEYVDLSTVQSTWTSGTAYAVGLSTSMDSTNIYIKMGATVAFGLIRKDTGGSYLVSTAGQQANWRIVVRAWL